jgi:hypothetical protein
LKLATYKRLLVVNAHVEFPEIPAKLLSARSFIAPAPISI